MQPQFSQEIQNLRRLTLTERQRLDLEQILNGGFAPLTGFLEESDYTRVVAEMRLENGPLWSMPIVLDISKADSFETGEKILLCDKYGYPIAIFTVTSIYIPDKAREARAVYGTENIEHPGVRYLMQETGDMYLGGPVQLMAYAPVYDFKHLRFSPSELREKFQQKQWNTVVAFQSRNPIHRAHYEIIRRAMRESGASALIHPTVGLTKEGDIDYVRRVRGYEKIVDVYFEDEAMLALLPLAMRMAGPREALWHALIRKNYGATHFIVGRDHAGPGADALGKAFYDPYAAQDLAAKHSPELGIEIVTVPELFFAEKERKYVALTELRPGDTPLHLSGTKFRAMLASDEEIPDWFSFPEVISELRSTKRAHRGFVLFFTGLPSAGKTTIARIVYQKLLEMKLPDVQLFDGDVVRALAPKKIGFDKRSRIAHVKRIGAAAEKVVKKGGIAICAAVAPYKEAREANRKRINKNSTYVEVFVNTPLEICEKRDVKGLYKKAREGNIKRFTGIDDPYEIPEKPEITIDTQKSSPGESADIVLDNLRSRGLL